MYSVPTAKVLADSISRNNIRLTTLQIRMHKFVLQEFNTHRMLSRNAASTRARPSTWVIDQVMIDPAMPVSWGHNKPGMQAGDEFPPVDVEYLQAEWLRARTEAVYYAGRLAKAGLHKQLVNRIVEPYMWADGVVTATDWDNFFGLRCHPDAQPEMRAIAEAMRTALQASDPVCLSPGQWHLPYVSDYEKEHIPPTLLPQLCTARCARVSIKPYDESKPNIDKDFDLHARLLQSRHLSPFEHAAVAMDGDQYFANFRGWRQYRRSIPGESVFTGASA
jgi:hypothetical protein